MPATSAKLATRTTIPKTRMFEASRVVALLAVMALAVSAGVWLKLVRAPRLGTLGRGRWLTGRVESASQLLGLALCLSAVAVVLAIAAWMVV